MRPGQTGEVEKDHLGILDLDRGDGDCLGRRDLMRRDDHEGRHGSAWMRGRGGDPQGRVPGLVLRYDDLVLYLLDPERGRHLGRVCVRFRGLGVALEEGNVGGSAAHFGGGRARGDGEKGRLGDGLSVVGGAQHGVRIVQDGLSDRARRNEFAEVLWQSWRVRRGRFLAGERDLAAGAADQKRSDVRFRNGWRACDAGGGRQALGVNGGAVWYGCHTRQ